MTFKLFFLSCFRLTTIFAMKTRQRILKILCFCVVQHITHAYSYIWLYGFRVNKEVWLIYVKNHSRIWLFAISVCLESVQSAVLLLWIIRKMLTNKIVCKSDESSDLLSLHNYLTLHILQFVNTHVCLAFYMDFIFLPCNILATDEPFNQCRLWVTWES